MVTATAEIDFIEQTELRQQAHYWRTQHARAVDRELRWKARALELEEIVRTQAAQIAELTQQLEALKSQVAWLQRQLFGRKSEQRDEVGRDADHGDQEVSDGLAVHRPRGKQPGMKGYGRTIRVNLPSEEILHDLPETQRCCQICGKPFLVFPGTEDSEEIHWDVRLVRRVHRRARYVPTCHCPGVPGIVTAPGPAKLIPKGMFSPSFWVHLLLEKFLFQRPLYRIRQVLALEGLAVSQGTLTVGLRRMGELLGPVYGRILDRCRSANHWHMDETRWKVFVEMQGKVSHGWWLWVAVTADTCVYLLDPFRSGKVPKHFLGEKAEGIINADRYSAYKTLGEGIRIAFCWGHVRRDFMKVRDGYSKLRSWGQKWLERIGELYGLNAQRLNVLSNPEAFGRADQTLRAAVASIEQTRHTELADTTLPSASKKVLESLGRHWEGLTLFVDHPEIPMDNNEAERRLRNPVVGRKNYYGSGAIWSGVLSATLFTLFQTLLKNNIDPQKWLLAYFQACAEQGGHAPENIEAFLPWNLSEPQKALWRHPP